MVKVTYVAVPHNCAAKRRISIDAQGFFILEFLYIFFARKIVLRFVYNDSFNVV